MASDKVKVAVRVRPINRRENDLGTKIIVDMEDNQTILKPANDRHDGRKQGKVFAFDHCFWSMDESNPKFADQEQVFDSVGKDILERAFEGYNGCIFAYGQTGSGKSYTMMGTRGQKGIIPRLCDRLFDLIKERQHGELAIKVEVSYMEIYNEKVHDLLDPKGSQQNLKVREHNILGPYVDGLSLLAVKSYEDIDNLMTEGNKSRTVAATNMNSESSRSHAVFNIIVTQTLLDTASGVSGEKVSKLSLVDLAGSERAQKTGAVGERLKEGSNINKSLTTLGLVISALADQSGGGKKGTKFVPYRDSVLTWLLKDNLGGNSKTVMVATISPAGDNYEETLSTLRYADRAKRIVNHAVVNEDPNARIIRELRDEVEMLRQQLSAAQVRTPSSLKAPDLQERLSESEKLMNDMSKTWEEKLAQTERVHMERHKALEQMGVSVQTSGIRLDNARPYLVNLNADPSLNELLVYYLKDHTLVGRPNAAQQQDIQLSGLGIMPEHAIVDVENNEVFITPLEGARTCVNGSVIIERQKVKHGDRIVWGNNHFFRLNCPKPSNSPQSPDSEEQQQRLGYDYAQQELMEKELSNDPIQEAIGAIEKQHEEDKQEALATQRQMYERQMQMLRSQLMSPGTPSFPLQLFDAQRLTPTASTANSIQRKYQQWAQDREKNFKQSLSKLREEVVKANALVREANFLSQEMGKQTEFHVTLQIPAANLSPNRRRGAFVSEPAILVKRKKRSGQIWTMEKLENKIIDMREMYEDRKSQGLPMMDNGPPQLGDPFYESQENHNLIGVANIFLECLFHDVKLDYHVPIISQQGEVAGKLHIEITKVGGAILDRYVDMAAEDNEEESVPMGAPLLIRVCIKEARGLPPALAHFVFCQYNFWGHQESVVVPPEINPEHLEKREDDTVAFTFNHEKVFRVPITEEFIEFCSDGALSVEVWGHRSQGFGQLLNLADTAQAKSRSVADRWNEVMRKIEMWVEFHELNDQGEYTPVEVIPKPEVPCAGVFQLRQGHSRRVLVRIKPKANSGTLPLICECITTLNIGCLTVRSKLQKGLDSYQEEDLSVLRDRWSKALARRKQYLDEQIQKLINKPDKTEADSERERALIEQWVCLTEERNAVLVPAPGSNIPGAPADWNPPPNVEEHSPVLFLDLNADDMSTPNAKEGLQAVGVNSILPKEHNGQFVTLPVIKYFTEVDNVCAIASWDSSLHDSANLNRVTPANERIYMVVKAVVRLSHPASMELVLRKRVAINIYKKQSLTSLTHMLKNRIIGSDYLSDSGVMYEVVSNLPKGSEELEDLETLAQMAASHNDTSAVDGETYIEKYIKGISAVESILTLDRLRQEVAVKELLTVSGRPTSLRKTTSVPNINQIVTSPTGLLHQQFRADSVQDLSLADQLSPNSRSFPATPKLTSPLSAAGGKLVKPMMTLVEEQHNREIKPLLLQDTEDDLDEEEDSPSHRKPHVVRRLMDPDTRSIDSDDYQEFESYQSQQLKGNGKDHSVPHPAAAAVTCTQITPSSTTDSFAEAPGVKGYTPSMTSSGYGSQAVSTLTLSSDDSISVKSMEEQPENAGTKSGTGTAANLKRSSTGASDSDAEDGSSDKTSKSAGEEEEEEEREGAENAEENTEENVKENAEENVKENAEDSSASGDKSAASSSGVYTQQGNASTDETGSELEGGDAGGRNRSDSLLDDQVPDIKDSPLKPLPSPSVTGTDQFFSEEENSGRTSADVDSDPYSVTAMEELERLGEEEEDGDISNMDDSISSFKSPPPTSHNKNNKPTIEASTPTDKKKGSGKKRGSGMRPRPKSMVVSPQAEVVTRAWQDDVQRRSSLHLSEDSLQAMDDNMSECSFGSRADLDRLMDMPIPAWVQEGEAVTVTSSSGPSKTGLVRFIGPVIFAPGNWIGVELDQPEGKNDGSVKGIRYFQCRNRHGIFVRPDKLIWDKKRKTSRKGSNPANRRSVQGISSSSPSVTSPSNPSSFMKATSASVAKKK
ncbi:kinesin-like protein KIF13A isoform X2 [Littorina saxatilis]|uniref:kinesin-like protein KIF13A isoform X2 n=1 Tax=Littorina saxatilis TaxID=31220 RepID=UPI0038B6455A